MRVEVFEEWAGEAATRADELAKALTAASDQPRGPDDEPTEVQREGARACQRIARDQFERMVADVEKYLLARRLAVPRRA